MTSGRDKRYEFELPFDLIARFPADRRDESRLIFADAGSGKFEDAGLFRNIKSLLKEGDLLLLNDTRVVPARLWGKRATGGKVEILVLEWEGSKARAMVRPLTKLREGEPINCSGQTIVLKKKNSDGTSDLEFSGASAAEVMAKLGEPPIPPYLKRRVCPDDGERYQTVYAKSEGAVAAPTAGLHFTRDLLGEIASTGVEIAYLTLHVGYGTFAPVSYDQKDLHAERYQIPASTMEKIRLRKKGTAGRVIAVGTTVMRALESCAATGLPEGSTRIFIKPGHEFLYADAMITNFHLPGSSLLMLVHAFAGPLIFDIYEFAIRNGFRFFSYGDVMMIERNRS